MQQPDPPAPPVESKAAVLLLTHLSANTVPHHMVSDKVEQKRSTEDTASVNQWLEWLQGYHAAAAVERPALRNTLKEQGLPWLEGVEKMTLRAKVWRQFRFHNDALYTIDLTGDEERRIEKTLDARLIKRALKSFNLQVQLKSNKGIVGLGDWKRGQTQHAYLISQEWLNRVHIELPNGDVVHDLMAGAALWPRTLTYFMLKCFDRQPWTIADFRNLLASSACAVSVHLWQGIWDTINRGSYVLQHQWSAGMRREFPDLVGLPGIAAVATQAQKQQATTLAYRAAKLKGFVKDLNDTKNPRDVDEQAALLIQYMGGGETDGKAETVRMLFEEELMIAGDNMQRLRWARRNATLVWALRASLKRQTLSFERICDTCEPTVTDLISLSIVLLMRNYDKWKNRIFFYHIEHQLDDEDEAYLNQLLRCAYVYDSKTQQYREPAVWPQLKSYYVGALAIHTPPGHGWLPQALYDIHPEVRQSAFVTALGPFHADRLKYTPTFMATRGDPSSEEVRGKKRRKVMGPSGSRLPPLLGRGADASERLDLSTFERMSEGMKDIGPNIGKFMMGRARAVKMFRDS